MTVELARRLIESGVPLADIEAALLEVVVRQIPLSVALLQRDPGLWARIEQELSRSELQSVLTVRASPELLARLPEGMCRRLMAVPVHVDPRSGRVDVAAVEPLDPHLAQEFGFHLEQPIRVLQATHDAVAGALDKLDKLQHKQKVSVLPPRAAGALGSDAPIPLVKVEGPARSDAPIPLVRRSMLPKSPSVPPVGRRVAPSASPAAAPAAEAEKLSWRSKPPPVDLMAGVQPPSAEVAPLAASAPARTAREALEEATTPEEVLLALRDALAPTVSIIFTVKNASFDGRIASPTVEGRVPAKQLSLLSHQPSVLETALKSGFYLGPVPNTPNHRELRDALPPDTTNEVYVTVITVSERPSLLWLLAGFEQSLDLTRRADDLALAAGRALARILRQRKRVT